MSDPMAVLLLAASAIYVSLGVGLLVLADLTSPLTWARRALVAMMAAGAALALVISGVRTFPGLEPPPPIVLATGRAS